MILNKLNSSKDLKTLSVSSLNTLCDEIRELIINTVLDNGGHLSSNLGVVELITALHFVFDFSKDKIIFDVGHQCYTHKILTGRYLQFNSLRKIDGISGFPNISESKYDFYNSGHASTALAIANGIASSNNVNGEIISIIGDGACTGGLFYEALENLYQVDKKQIIIINQNNYSIAKNTNQSKKFLDKMLSNISTINESLEYLEILDGNDINILIKQFEKIKNNSNSFIVKVITQKGYGYKQSEKDPIHYHSVSKLENRNAISFSDTFGATLSKLAKTNNQIKVITAAMIYGTGLEIFEKEHKDMLIDVGIAEEYALALASGLALSGIVPFVAIYSTFLQRAYDQIIHDISLNNLHVVFCIDRAGIVPNDGETHQGIYDLGFLNIIPNMTIIAPKNSNQLEQSLKFALSFSGPIAIRYPKGAIEINYKYNNNSIILGKWEVVYGDITNDFIIISFGRMLENAIGVAKKLEQNKLNCCVINALFIKPLDTELLEAIKYKKIVVIEDNLKVGGLAESINSYYNSIREKIQLLDFSLCDTLPCGDLYDLQTLAGIDVESLFKSISSFLYEKN